MNERDAIERLRRIATHPAARGLTDDAAVLGDLVLTHDSIAENVHFLPEDPPSSVGWKLVAVNLSDLAAKGAQPVAALLSLALSGDDAWDRGFLDGVEAACESYGLPLIGGDTISLPQGAPLVFGLTAIGRGGRTVPSRAGARAGDRLWLVGTIGDAAAGLEQLRADRSASGPLVETYRRPVPLLGLGQALAEHASAMMDVSDGLLLDALRMASASGLSVSVDLGSFALSEAFLRERGNSLESRLFAASGGDDYALLAALPPEVDVLSLSLSSRPTIACIGTFRVGGEPLSLAMDGERVPVPERLGFEHVGQHHRSHPASPVADRH